MCNKWAKLIIPFYDDSLISTYIFSVSLLLLSSYLFSIKYDKLKSNLFIMVSLVVISQEKNKLF